MRLSCVSGVSLQGSLVLQLAVGEPHADGSRDKPEDADDDTD